jgi:hypothetical protein
MHCLLQYQVNAQLILFNPGHHKTLAQHFFATSTPKHCTTQLISQQASTSSTQHIYSKKAPALKV